VGGVTTSANAESAMPTTWAIAEEVLALKSRFAVNAAVIVCDPTVRALVVSVATPDPSVVAEPIGVAPS